MRNESHIEGFGYSGRICRLVKGRGVRGIAAFIIQAGGDQERENEDDWSERCGVIETKDKTEFLSMLVVVLGVKDQKIELGLAQ